MFIVVKNSMNEDKKALININDISAIKEDTEYYGRIGTYIQLRSQSVIISSEPFNDVVAKITKELRKEKKKMSNRFKLMDLS